MSVGWFDYGAWNPLVLRLPPTTGERIVPRWVFEAIPPEKRDGYTIEIMIKLPPDFQSGGVLNIPGIWMKQAEETQGTALAGLAIKVTTGYFLIGLSATPAERDRNVQLLKDRPWFEMPIVYTNNRRAILAVEKGTPGDNAFKQAFAVWEK